MCELSSNLGAAIHSVQWANNSKSLLPNLDDYDRFIVFMSGGKDSVAATLHLLEQGVPKNGYPDFPVDGRG